MVRELPYPSHVHGSKDPAFIALPLTASNPSRSCKFTVTQDFCTSNGDESPSLPI